MAPTPSPRNNVGGFHLSYSGSLTGVLVDAARVGRGRVEKRVGAVHASDVALGTGIERPPRTANMVTSIASKKTPKKHRIAQLWFYAVKIGGVIRRGFRNSQLLYKWLHVEPRCGAWARGRDQV